MSNVEYEPPWPNGNTRLDLAAVVPAVAHEQPLGVGHLPVVAGEVAVRRRVIDLPWERRRETPTRVGVAEQHVDERVGHLLATEPRLHDRRHLVRPTASAPVQPVFTHHDGAGIRGDDGRDERVLCARECERRAVLALGLPVVVRTDHDHRDVGGGRGR